ncbi:hypothetical protein SASPL_146056 [Salvia splendens]|uniref:Disease resistance protein RPS2 n=1 Tax=Salvia splendens TaxID=180675 RepID=A0A8X8Z875_SALSN|nr:hypothetical protein SASPL_146056 [Salvia splendens]
MPERLFYNNQNLSSLCISECPVLRELPDGLDTLHSLEKLFIFYCENLKSIGNASGGARQSEGILYELRIIGCGELMELPCEMLESWAPTIEDLVLEGLRRLKNLPMLIDCLAKSSTRLTRLTIRGVPKLKGASVESWDLSSLKSLSIDVSVEWSREDSVGIAETVEGMLQLIALLKFEGDGKLGVAAPINSISHLCLCINIGEYRSRRIAPMVGEPLISIRVISRKMQQVEASAFCGCIEAPH